MARWDEILTLPVQSPPTLEFSAADIVWSRVEGWRETMDRLALIPFTRVNDFLRGESNNKDCPTKFHVEARRRRPLETTCKPKVDGILEYILYWCSFGPDDHRKGGEVRPSRTFSAKRKTPAGRPNTKRGCVCHFIVKRLIAEPSVALIIYNKDKHVDKQGLPCHGPQDRKAVGTQAMFAPYISDELRLQIMSLLHVGVPVETIMQRHTEAVEKQGGPRNRDDLLTHRYVRRLERKIRRSTYEFDSDDVVSISVWVDNHRDHIFFYEDFSNSEPFALGIQTEWQLQQMIRFGNHRILAADSRFGTNKLKYPIYSLLVFDSNNNAIPVAWIMTPNFASGEIHRWMRALYDRVHSKDPTWKLGGFIVDDPSTDVVTIREVFQCSVLISFWRVRHAWHKSLMEKCSDMETRGEISRRLGDIIASICRGNGDVDMFEAFLEDFIDCSDFLDYFKAVWYPRIETWTSALRALPLASIELSAAVECYHTQLKLRLLNEEDPSIYQRADWLIDKLGTKVHSYYWLDEYSGKENFARYWKDEWKSGLSSWRMALQIPNSDVILDGKCAKVVSSKDQDVMHIVLNPGSEFAICECSWSRMGNICKHMIKTTRVYRDKGLATSSTSLFQYNRILTDILNCSPNDSVIRDHAVTLAVSMQSQLSKLFGPGSSDFPSEQPSDAAEPGFVATGNLDISDEDLMNERQPLSDNHAEILVNGNHSFAENNDVSGETARGSMADGIVMPSETLLPGKFSNDEQPPSNDVITNDQCDVMVSDHKESEAGLDSNTCDASRIALTDNISIDDRPAEDATAASGDQTSNRTCQNSDSEMRININPPSTQCSLSSSRFGVSNGFAENGCAFQSSGAKVIRSSDISEGHPLDSVTTNGTEIGSPICHSSDTNMATHHRDRDVLENGSNEGHKLIPVTSGPDNRVLEHLSGDCNDTVMNSERPKEKAVINHKIDDALVDEDSCDTIMEERDGGPFENAAATIDDDGGNALEDATDSMNFEMVHVLGDSSDISKDGMDVASDAPSVINGVA